MASEYVAVGVVVVVVVHSLWGCVLGFLHRQAQNRCNMFHTGSPREICNTLHVIQLHVIILCIYIYSRRIDKDCLHEVTTIWGSQGTQHGQFRCSNCSSFLRIYYTNAVVWPGQVEFTAWICMHGALCTHAMSPRFGLKLNLVNLFWTRSNAERVATRPRPFSTSRPMPHSKLKTLYGIQ